MKRIYTLDIINALSLHLKSKTEYVNILKQLRNEERKKFVIHVCSNAFDFGNWIVIRSVFKISNRFTKEHISIEIGFREWKGGKR